MRQAGVRGLLLACHPVPTAGVTVLATTLAVAAGHRGPDIGLVAAAVLTGQLSVGWSNDAIDAERDRQSARDDKPVAAGAVERRSVAIAALVAFVVTIGLSLALDLSGGALHLLFVGCGWAYNLGLKGTVLSWVPYAVGFAALPAFVVVASPGHPTPPWWLPAAGGLLGVSAHLVNVLPDLDDDLAAGVRGWPHRLGRRRSTLAAVLALATASVLLVVAPPGPAEAGALVGLGVALVLATGVAWLGLRRPHAGRPLILGVTAIALTGVALLVAGTDRFG